MKGTAIGILRKLGTSPGTRIFEYTREEVFVFRLKLRLIGLLLCVVFSELFSLSLSAAQQEGELVGAVLGPNRTCLCGTQITVKRLEDGAVVSVVAGMSGSYRASGLRAGRYELKAELKGFEPKVLPPIVLAEGETKTVDIPLEIATVKTIVTVIGSLPTRPRTPSVPKNLRPMFTSLPTRRASARSRP